MVMVMIMVSKKAAVTLLPILVAVLVSVLVSVLVVVLASALIIVVKALWARVVEIVSRHYKGIWT